MQVLGRYILPPSSGIKVKAFPVHAIEIYVG
jgi:hypothetical protein